jgi:RNA methyltransferase, TrmH family
MLTSTQNPQVKMARQLQQRREVRELEGRFVAEGARLTDDLIGSGMKIIYSFLDTNPPARQWKTEHPEVNCIEVNDTVMRHMSLETTPPGILVVFEIPAAGMMNIASSLDVPVLILDALRDPGNLGACLRVAAGADCKCVLLTPGCVDPYNPKVVRGGMGAHARLHIASLSWENILAVCGGRSIWAADASGNMNYDEVKWSLPSALIIGGEVAGISRDAYRASTGSVSIPLANQVESLNASVACGVILFEAARQRRLHL